MKLPRVPSWKSTPNFPFTFYQNLHKRALKLNDPVVENPGDKSSLRKWSSRTDVLWKPTFPRERESNSNDDRLFSPREIGCKQPVETEATMRTGDTRQRILDKQKLPPGDVVQTRKRRKLPRIFTQSNISHGRLTRRWVSTSLSFELLSPVSIRLIFSSSIVFLPSPSPPIIVFAFARTIATF